jgi:predicted negative regulator of RcsB-dependent stress response
MADDKLPQFVEDDDVARARAFWNENGKSIVTGLILGLGGIVGFNYWNNYQQTHGEDASVLFDNLRSGQEGIDKNAIASELKENYQSTAYADLAALAMAKHYVEQGDLDAAATELNWVIGNSKDSGFQHIARLRLGSVFLAQENPVETLELLSVADKSGFESRYHELIGDAYIQRKQDGDSELARTEYRKSLETLSVGSPNTGLIQLKLDNLGDS